MFNQYRAVLLASYNIPPTLILLEPYFSPTFTSPTKIFPNFLSFPGKHFIRIYLEAGKTIHYNEFHSLQ